MVAGPRGQQGVVAHQAGIVHPAPRLQEDELEVQLYANWQPEVLHSVAKLAAPQVFKPTTRRHPMDVDRNGDVAQERARFRGGLKLEVEGPVRRIHSHRRAGGKPGASQQDNAPGQESCEPAA
ncbi:hypothetical protein D9M68_959320 [compost metagenome]